MIEAKERLVVVGNGMAGIRVVEELLKLAPERYDITVFGAEPHGNYNRILLSPVLAGEKTIADIITHPLEWYAQNGITLHANDPVIAIDHGARTVTSLSGRVVHYDRLLLATGSQPFVLPVPGRALPGVVAFRTIYDVDAMIEATRQHRRAVVIGGGLLGLEAANGLARQGMDVTLVHLMDWLMERQLDPVAAGLLQGNLEARGLKFKLKAQTESILGDDRVRAVRFKDGTEVDADLVVMAAGIVPDAALAKSAGLNCERGIVVDDTLLTSDANVFAVGECAQHRKVCYGLVAPLWEQARVVAAQLSGDASARYEGSVISTKLKVTGIDLFSAGNFMGGDGTEQLVFRDPRRGIYKKLVLREGRLDGAVLYGDTQDGGWYFDLVQSRQNVAPFRDRLLFGRRFVEAKAA
jgi:nitrite reductase (NADH) large subunit